MINNANNNKTQNPQANTVVAPNAIANQNTNGGQTPPVSNVNAGQNVGNPQNNSQQNQIVNLNQNGNINQQNSNNNQVVTNTQKNGLNASTTSTDTASELSQAEIEKQGAINILNEQLKVIEDQAEQIKTNYESIKDPAQKNKNLLPYQQAMYNNLLQQVELKKKLCALKQNDALSSELYQEMKKSLGDAPEDVTLQKVLNVASSVIGQFDYDEQKKIKKELEQTEGLSTKDKLNYIGVYLKRHPNFLKTDREIMKNQSELGYDNFSNILSRDKLMNEAISEKKDQIYQDINRGEKLNEQIRKLSKDIAEIDEQIGLWEKIKDIFGLSQLCKQKREYEADQNELKDQKMAAKIRESQLNKSILDSENTLRTAILVANKKAQDLTDNIARTTISQEKNMQMFNIKNSDNMDKLSQSLVHKNVTGQLLHSI